MASSDGGRSDEAEDDGHFVPAMVSGDMTKIAVIMKSWPVT